MRRLLAPLLSIPLAIAQAPSAWATLNVPAGVVASQAASQGKLITYRDGGTLHAWSAVTRRWVPAAVTGSATLRLNNDCLLVQDGTTWSAFAAYGGGFVPLPVSGSAQLLNATNAVNDSLLLVADGGQLHSFSAFTGTWQSRPLAPAHLVAVQRHCAVLVQGTLVSGLDAYTGLWTDHAVAAAPNTVSADGTAAFAFGVGTAHAFSATRRTWSDHHELANATFARADDWGTWFNGQRSIAYSAIRGTFAHSALPVTSLAGVQDVFALYDGPAGVFAFSAITGDFRGPLAAPGAQVAANVAAALLTDASGTVAYSAVHNRIAPRGSIGPTSGVANVVAWTSDPTGGPAWFFSALTGTWHRGPANALPGDPLLTTTSAGMLVPGGCVAFEPRSTNFVPLADPTVVLSGNPSSAPLLAIGATMLHAFDPRGARWISTPRSGSGTVIPNIWRTGAVLFDGSVAHGYGAQAGSWSQQLLAGPVTGLRANSESTRVQTANSVHAWSALGEVGWFAQFPEFRRVQPHDAPLTCHVSVPANALALVGFGAPAPTPLPLPGLGDLLLQPATVATLLVAPTPTATTHLVPLAPPQSGLPRLVELAVQAAVWPIGANPYLGDPARTMPL